MHNKNHRIIKLGDDCLHGHGCIIGSRHTTTLPASRDVYALILLTNYYTCPHISLEIIPNSHGVSFIWGACSVNDRSISIQFVVPRIPTAIGSCTKMTESSEVGLVSAKAGTVV